jgi:hypothetical protein
MFNGTPQYGFWVAWRFFSVSQKLFLLALFALSVYTVYCLAKTVSCIRATKERNDEESRKVAEQILSALQRRSSRLQNLIGTAFYVFGIVLFATLQWSYVTLDQSRSSIVWTVLSDFQTSFIFAFNVFTLFLILHVLRWMTSGFVDRFRFQLRAGDTLAERDFRTKA